MRCVLALLLTRRTAGLVYAPPRQTTNQRRPIKKSALVFGWFQASAKELKYVKNLYKDNGYEEVTVVPSRIQDYSRPWGWYRIFLKRHVQHRLRGSPLCRDWTAIHCLSGGFLNFYLLRAAGVDVRASKLLLDSTPILPTPRALTRFSRSFLRSKGFGPLVKCFPFKLHVFMVWTNLVLGACFAQIIHFGERIFIRASTTKTAVDRRVMDWVSRFRTAMTLNQFDRTIAETADVVFQPFQHNKSINFLYSKTDPFISNIEIDYCKHRAFNLCPNIYVHNVAFPHVFTAFKKPKLLFRILDRE